MYVCMYVTYDDWDAEICSCVSIDDRTRAAVLSRIIAPTKAIWVIYEF